MAWSRRAVAQARSKSRSGVVQVSGLEAIARLGVAGVERERHRPPAPLQGVFAVAGVGEEEPAVGQQERAEPAPRRIGGGHRTLLEQPGEERLRQVVRVVGVVAVATDVGEDRVPVGGAKLRERGAALGVRRAAGMGDAAPPGGREAGGMA